MRIVYYKYPVKLITSLNALCAIYDKTLNTVVIVKVATIVIDGVRDTGIVLLLYLDTVLLLQLISIILKRQKKRYRTDAVFFITDGCN